MPQLVECAGDTCLRAIVVPAFLHRLVAHWPSSPVLFRSKQRPMFVAHPFQVGSELLHQMRIVEQERLPFATFPHDSQMFVVEREINILHVQGESLADPQASFQKEAEKQAVTLTISGNDTEDTFNLVALYATRLWRIRLHPLNLEHGVAVKQFVLMRPGEEACHGSLLARSGGRTKVQVHVKEIPQDLRCHRIHWPRIERTQLR